MPEVLDHLCSEGGSLGFRNLEPGSMGKRGLTEIMLNHNGVAETGHAIGIWKTKDRVDSSREVLGVGERQSNMYMVNKPLNTISHRLYQAIMHHRLIIIRPHTATGFTWLGLRGSPGFLQVTSVTGVSGVS